MGSTTKNKDYGRPVNKRYWEHYEFTSQFEGAERIADKWDISREDADAFGLRSQVIGAKAWDEDAFGTQIVPVTVPVLDDDGKETGDTITVTRDGGLRDTTLEGAGRTQAGCPRGRRSHRRLVEPGQRRRRRRPHDDEGEGRRAGLTPLAEIVDVNLVGVDPVTMLDRPHRLDQEAARRQRPVDRRHRRLRDQRGLCIGCARLGERVGAPTWRRSAPTGARLRSVTQRRDRDHLADQGGARTPTQRRRVRRRVDVLAVCSRAVRCGRPAPMHQTGVKVSLSCSWVSEVVAGSIRPRSDQA